MEIVFGLIIILFGIMNIASPEMSLRWHDMFRLKGEREYSDFAIGMTRFGGVIGIIMGIVLIVISFQ